MTQVSPHFFQKEFTLNGKEFDYTPPLCLLIALEAYRELLKAEHEQKLEFMKPDAVFTGIAVTSFARTPAYNAKIGGHPKSHHLYATNLQLFPDAVDFTCEKFDMYTHKRYLHGLRQHMLTYGIYLSTGIYWSKRFIHLNLEHSQSDMRHWTL